jgi:hypothetical protein
LIEKESFFDQSNVVVVVSGSSVLQSLLSQSDDIFVTERIDGEKDVKKNDSTQNQDLKKKKN